MAQGQGQLQAAHHNAQPMQLYCLAQNWHLHGRPPSALLTHLPWLRPHPRWVPCGLTQHNLTQDTAA